MYDNLEKLKSKKKQNEIRAKQKEEASKQVFATGRDVSHSIQDQHAALCFLRLFFFVLCLLTAKGAFAMDK